MTKLHNEKLIACARKFVLTERDDSPKNGIFQPEIAIEWRSPNSWTIVINRMEVLNKNGNAEYEPSPSNRDSEFISRTRFSLEQAWAVAEKLCAVSGYKLSFTKNE